jgi:rhodanese-related sulfurtransferase
MELIMPNKLPINKAILIGGIILLIITIILLTLPILNNNGGIPAEISPNEAYKNQIAGAFMLDVRQPEEWNVGRIEGATLIPLSELPDRLDEVPKNMEIIVYCRSGNRSATARDLLISEGYQSVTSLEGGINNWVISGLPMVKGE